MTASSIEEIKKEALAEIAGASSHPNLQEIRVKYLGKKGVITAALKSLGTLPPEARPQAGAAINVVKEELLTAVETRKEALAERPAAEVDVTLPGRVPPRGTLHPLNAVMEEAERIFGRIGFAVALGPEVETDYYNFEALNFPPEHPARDEQDTLFVQMSGGGAEGEKAVLRTHTSPVQVRVYEAARSENAFPIKIIAPGRTFRADEIDATHSPVFHQIEGFYIDAMGKVSMADLKGTLSYFAHEFFGPGADVRFRPSFFPFVEPGAEVDVRCIFCRGEGCRICKQTGWIEILGAGMVHPRVLEYAGIDSERYTGFAFGMGVERITMLRSRVPDIRLFYENDLRFLRQFGGLGL